MPDVALFPGPVVNVPVAPYPSGLSYIGGGTSPWADATDDGTQAVLEVDHNGSDFTTFTRVTADLPPLVGTPTSLVAHMRAKNAMLGGAASEDAHVNVILTSASFSPFVEIGNEAPAYQHWLVAVDSLFRDYTLDLELPVDLYSHWGTSQAAIVAALQAGALHFQVQVDVHTPRTAIGMQVSIASLWLEAVGVPDVGGSALPAATRIYRTSPLRQFPRDDGLGTSSARRNFPTPKSVQASNRRAGGYL